VNGLEELALPESTHAISIQLHVITDNYEAFNLRLRHQHAIERIFVGTG
jgi:hypothetical protein